MKNEIVKNDKVNSILELKTVELDGFTFVDISYIKQESIKLDYIENNKQLLDDYNGFVIDKNVEINEFMNCSYITKQAYLFKGLVIIDSLTICIIHSVTVGILSSFLSQYTNKNVDIGVAVRGSIKINHNTCQQPDAQLYRIPEFPLLQNPYLILAFEVNFKTLPISKAIQKVLLYFNVPTINVVILFQIYDRDQLEGGGNFKAVAIVYERNKSIIYPSSIISFGTLPLSLNDITTYNQLSNNAPITGYLYNNNYFNNNINNPMFIITFNPQSLFFNNSIPVGIGPLEFNLYYVKQTMDLVPNFTALF